MKIHQGKRAPVATIATPALNKVWKELNPCERAQWDRLLAQMRDFIAELAKRFGCPTSPLNAFQLNVAEELTLQFISETEKQWRLVTTLPPWASHVNCEACCNCVQN